ncbi:hypothetical protein [Paenibacillus sp. GCM10012303]|uniref:hypothetical protein n=1 Tax=Paenibacillus sp. GCM10012303 TaxID=3317340 RepID=UPI00361928D2
MDTVERLLRRQNLWILALVGSVVVGLAVAAWYFLHALPSGFEEFINSVGNKNWGGQ